MSVGLPIAGRCIVLPGDVDGNPRRGTVVEGEEGEASEVKVLELRGALRENPAYAFASNSFNQDPLRCGPPTA